MSLLATMAPCGYLDKIKFFKGYLVSLPSDLPYEQFSTGACKVVLITSCQGYLPKDVCELRGVMSPEGTVTQWRRVYDLAPVSEVFQRFATKQFDKYQGTIETLTPPRGPRVAHPSGHVGLLPGYAQLSKKDQIIILKAWVMSDTMAVMTHYVLTQGRYGDEEGRPGKGAYIQDLNYWQAALSFDRRDPLE